MTASTSATANQTASGTRQESQKPQRKVLETQVLVDNRQARHLYLIEDTFTAGLMLQGWEVKAIPAGQANFNGGGAYVTIKDGEAFIQSMSITPLLTARKGLLEEIDPARSRKLLLNRTELTKLSKRVGEKGYTVVPLALTYNGKMKLEIGLAKGKKLADKREATKQRDIKRDMARDIKSI